MRISIFFFLLFSFHVGFCQEVLLLSNSVEGEVEPGGSYTFIIQSGKWNYHTLAFNTAGADLFVTIMACGSMIDYNIQNNGQIQFYSPIDCMVKVILKPNLHVVNKRDISKYKISYVNRTTQKRYKKINEVENGVFLKWLKKNAHDINNISDYKEVFEGKEIVALGEATHGSKEMFLVKQRLMEYLVQELDFKILAFEASRTAFHFIDNYVAFGMGNLDSALSIQTGAHLDTKEFKAIIEWVRKYNERLPFESRVHIKGIDIQDNKLSYSFLSDFFLKIGIDRTKELRELMESENSDGYSSNDTTLRKLIPKVDSLISDITTKKGKWEEATSGNEVSIALLHLKTIRQFLISFSYNPWVDKRAQGGRDYFMYKNILDILQQSGKPKIIVWAHNQHVRKDFQDGINLPSMGNYLANFFGNKFYSVGFDFFAGQFRANSLDITTPGWEIVEFPSAPEGNFSHYVSDLGLKNVFIDFSLSKKSTVVKRWLLNKRIGIYQAGAIFSQHWPEDASIGLITLQKAFDGVIVIKNTTAANPLRN